MPQKRTLDSFFAPSPSSSSIPKKKARASISPPPLRRAAAAGVIGVRESSIVDIGVASESDVLTGGDRIKEEGGEVKECKTQRNGEVQDFDSKQGTPSEHPTYPFAIAALPPSLHDAFAGLPAKSAKVINDQPQLDLLYFQPYLASRDARALFEFLRSSLPFYRVRYAIKRGSVETMINTPRYTTVFGVDETSVFKEDDKRVILEQSTKKPVGEKKYACKPRPIPDCLDELRKKTEQITGDRFNFCLVNFYADGNDSISYHSDDERFLGPEPAIASFSLGARRDFLMKHKPPPATGSTSRISENDNSQSQSKPLKLPLGSGDMVLMRGGTQANWLHSIPKRKTADDGGRINITFRRAMVKGGTENYYRYNVGDGGVYIWSERQRQMVPWQLDGAARIPNGK